MRSAWIDAHNRWVDEKPIWEEGYNEGKEYERNHPTYTHRNGETTPPTVDGWYWVAEYNHLYMDMNPVYGNTARYYGPIPEPEETNP